MIEPNTIEKLKKYNDSPFQILSVYVGTDEVQSPSSEFLKTQFHSLLHQHMTKDLRTVFQSDIERIQAYLDGYIPLYRSLAFFAAGPKLWEVIGLEFSLPATLSTNNSPSLEPLLRSLHKYTTYLVVLIDREKARIFTVGQGEIIDHIDVTGDYVPPRVKATGGDSVGGAGDIKSRHNEMLLKHHIDQAVKEIFKFTRRTTVQFVIIGGHKEMLKRIRDSLPNELRTKVVGTFVTEVDLPLNELLLQSKEIAATTMHARS
jgi:peptide subunit release factor 1 (eRF1)